MTSSHGCDGLDQCRPAIPQSSLWAENVQGLPTQEVDYHLRLAWAVGDHVREANSGYVFEPNEPIVEQLVHKGSSE